MDQPKEVILEFEAGSPVRPWNSAQRILFRLAFVYFLLYIFPFPFKRFEFLNFLSSRYAIGEAAVVTWAGRHVVGIEKPVVQKFNGSGDTTFDFVHNFCILVVAAVIALIWSALGTRKTRYPFLHDLLRIYIRFFLGITLIGYGMDKVFPLQFPAPSPGRLMSTYGDSSPMGLLWTFMGFSTAYEVFAGAIETLAGLLLLFRRTTTLGSLLSVCVLTNIVMLNFCFDVPVKLLSSNLLLMAVFLLMPELRRLLNFLVLNRPTTTATLLPIPGPRWTRVLRVVFGLALGGYCSYSICHSIVQDWRSRATQPGSSLRGFYDIESFTQDGKEVPPLTTNAKRWRSALVNEWGYLSVRLMDDTRQGAKLDGEAHTATFLARENPNAKEVLALAQQDDGHISIQGKLSGDSIRVSLRKIKTPSSLLMDRGFHWINEFPFNR
ncbi:MAG TPA: hypothetical protein VMV81_05070 [Phycisphaerae bacterium]|nr:hypothetical protein [Phycisphaerae bacterium]